MLAKGEEIAEEGRSTRPLQRSPLLQPAESGFNRDAQRVRKQRSGWGRESKLDRLRFLGAVCTLSGWLMTVAVYGQTAGSDAWSTILFAPLGVLAFRWAAGGRGGDAQPPRGALPARTLSHAQTAAGRRSSAICAALILGKSGAMMAVADVMTYLTTVTLMACAATPLCVRVLLVVGRGRSLAARSRLAHLAASLVYILGIGCDAAGARRVANGGQAPGAT